jgi:rod shape-determining protein MreC
MQKQSSTVFTFVFLLICSIFLFFLSSLPLFQPIVHGVSFFTSPIQQSFYQVVYSPKQTDEKIQVLSKENEALRKQLIDQKKLLTENSALKDQFKTSYPSASQLVQATIIGAPGFVPGVSPAEKLILNKGSSNGVVKGQAVVSRNNLIGTISQVSPTMATVSLVSNGTTPFTAKTLETQALGVVNQAGGEFALENVLLSQQLKRGDMVLTKGDRTDTGEGLPPDLVVGEIIDIDKKASNLFQTAKLKSLIDISHLQTVFIMQQSR